MNPNGTILPEYEQVKLDEVRRYHYILMREYVNILNQISSLPFFIDSFKVLGFSQKVLGRMAPLRLIMNILTWKFLVKFFVESHIKGKLNELRNSYIQISQTFEIVRQDQIDDNQTWLSKVKEECTEFADTLPSWQNIRRLIIIIGTLIVGFFVATSNVNNIYQAILIIKFEVAIGLIIYAAFSFLFISFTFDYKRSLFRPGSGFLWESILPQQHKESIKNIYNIEDNLFSLLGKTKIREFPVDIVAFAQIFIVFGATAILLQQITNGRIIAIFIGCSFILIGIYSLINGIQDRKWR